MELNTAIQLIQRGLSADIRPQHWLDLGAGSGLFTRALAELLPAGSQVTAVDKNAPLVATAANNGIKIGSLQADFTSLSPSLLAVDGIVMANSLHYVADQKALLSSMLHGLLPGGRIVLVEYNTDRKNPWVPYPISFQKLEGLVQQLRTAKVSHLAIASSQYHAGGMYSALIQLKEF